MKILVNIDEMSSTGLGLETLTPPPIAGYSATPNEAVRSHTWNLSFPLSSSITTYIRRH